MARPLRAMTPDWASAPVAVGCVLGGGPHFHLGHHGSMPAVSELTVDSDHVARAERAAHRDRDRVDQGAVEQPATIDGDRTEDAGQRIGGAHRVDELAARQPDLVPGADLGGNRNEALGQVLDADALQRVVEHVAQPLAGDRARSPRN